MKKNATMKDAIDLLIVHEGFDKQLPENFMPYWNQLSSVIDTLGADTTKKTKTKKPNKKRKKNSDKTIDATPIPDETPRKITLPNGNEIDIDMSVTKEMVNFIKNVPISSEKKSPSKHNTSLSICSQDECKKICDTIMGHDCAVLDGENIQCNFMYEDLACKLESYLTGNTNQKIDESNQEEVDNVESGKRVRANWSIQPMKVNERLCEWIITLKPKNNPARSLLQELDGSKDTGDTKTISANKDKTSTITEGMHGNKNAITTDGVGTSHK